MDTPSRQVFRQLTDNDDDDDGGGGGGGGIVAVEFKVLSPAPPCCERDRCSRFRCRSAFLENGKPGDSFSTAKVTVRGVDHWAMI